MQLSQRSTKGAFPLPALPIDWVSRKKQRNFASSRLSSQLLKTILTADPTRGRGRGKKNGGSGGGQTDLTNNKPVGRFDYCLSLMDAVKN